MFYPMFGDMRRALESTATAAAGDRFPARPRNKKK
jgi:hypothetical protein